VSQWLGPQIHRKCRKEEPEFLLYLLRFRSILPLHWQQVTNLQNSHQAYMDIRHRTVGLRQQSLHCHNTESPIQNTPIHHERTMVCIQPHFTQRSKNSLRYRNYQTKEHQVLQQTIKPLQPTSSTTTTNSRKSQTQKKLAGRFKELRKTSLDIYPLTSRRV
jgi:hypothetical protein